MPTLEWAKQEAVVRAATRAPFRLLKHVPALSFGDPDNEGHYLKVVMDEIFGRMKSAAIAPALRRGNFKHIPYDIKGR